MDRSLKRTFLTATISLHATLIGLAILLNYFTPWLGKHGVSENALPIFVFLSLLLVIACFGVAYFLRGFFFWWIITSIIAIKLVIIIFRLTLGPVGILS